MRSRSGLFSVIIIVLGLWIVVWRMSSTEETVFVPRKKVEEAISQTKDDVPSKNEVDSSAKKNEPRPLSAIVQNRKLAVLQEILDSKNDNDPRLDSDFKFLNDTEKRALQVKYLSYTPEKLNERGTLIYLLGRNIENEKDLDFLGYVLSESPCLSLSDCTVQGPSPTGELAHLNSVDQITLVYPQIVAIKSIEPLLTQNNVSAGLKSKALKNLADASRSKNRQIARMATATIRKNLP